jgi:hypothetical protein
LLLAFASRRTLVPNAPTPRALGYRELEERFVQVVQSHYPEISDLFQRLGIERDPIAMAYAGEIFLEMLAYREFKWFLKSAGIGFPSPTLLKSRRGLYIYDKRLRHALHQLTLKVYHLDLYNDADKRKIPKKMFKLAKRIWNWWQRMVGDGWVGEALGVAGPFEERGVARLEPRFDGDPAKAGKTYTETAPSKAPDTRPTDHHSRNLIPTPFSPLILTGSRVYGLRLSKIYRFRTPY